VLPAGFTAGQNAMHKNNGCPGISFAEPFPFHHAILYRMSSVVISSSAALLRTTIHQFLAAAAS
jgi:hypothetical protein